jgi:hypothetical protein
MSIGSVTSSMKPQLQASGLPNLSISMIQNFPARIQFEGANSCHQMLKKRTVIRRVIHSGVDDEDTRFYTH